jgi:nitrogen fixation protein NifU and related proteins
MLRELYQEMIIDHGKNPRNFGELCDANLQQVGHNPLCGDKLVVYAQEVDGHIEAVRFKGEGCAISMASASLMTELLQGKTLQEAQHLFAQFHLLVTGGETTDDLGKLAIFAGVAEFPVRVKCATLAWHTIMAALEHNKEIVSTE